MNRKGRFSLAALGAALFAVVVACHDARPPAPRQAATGPDLPQIKAEGWLNGPSISRADLEGRVAVIDVWAYW